METKNSKVADKIEAILREQQNQIRKRFPKYDLAVAEIARLQDELYTKELLLKEATATKPRGRPAKKSSPPYLSRLLSGELQTPQKKMGRPKKYFDPHFKIIIWEEFRANYAKKIGKNLSNVSDKETVEYFLKLPQHKKLTRVEKNELVKELRSTVKFLRDTTGIRIRTRQAEKS